MLAAAGSAVLVALIGFFYPFIVNGTGVVVGYSVMIEVSKLCHEECSTLNVTPIWFSFGRLLLLSSYL